MGLKMPGSLISTAPKKPAVVEANMSKSKKKKMKKKAKKQQEQLEERIRELEQLEGGEVDPEVGEATLDGYCAGADRRIPGLDEQVRYLGKEEEDEVERQRISMPAGGTTAFQSSPTHNAYNNGQLQVNGKGNVSFMAPSDDDGSTSGSMLDPDSVYRKLERSESTLNTQGVAALSKTGELRRVASCPGIFVLIITPD